MAAWAFEVLRSERMITLAPARTFSTTSSQTSSIAAARLSEASRDLGVEETVDHDGGETAHAVTFLDVADLASSSVESTGDGRTIWCACSAVSASRFSSHRSRRASK